MEYHKLPKTIETNYKTMSQEILRRYGGEIDRFVTDAYDLAGGYVEGKPAPIYVAVHLYSIIKTDSFYKGQYVGLASAVWKIVAVEIGYKLMDPPIPFLILKLDRIEDYAPTQTPEDPTEG